MNQSVKLLSALHLSFEDILNAKTNNLVSAGIFSTYVTSNLILRAVKPD